MEITVVISALVGIATRKEFSPGNLFRLYRRKVLSSKVSQFFLLGGLPRAIDLAELALAVSALARVLYHYSKRKYEQKSVVTLRLSRYCV